MFKLLLLFLFSTLLSANNPIVYAALGDVIYNNVQSIKNLKNIPAYQEKFTNIDTYITKVATTKKMGFGIENGDTTLDKKVYLQNLRALSKENDMYIRNAQGMFKQCLENGDSATFEELVNSGLIDTKRNKDKILKYYYEHSEDINVTGVIEEYLAKDSKLAVSSKKRRQYENTKKRKAAAKIHRIRKEDVEEQKKIEKKLDAELKQKKKAISKKKLKELIY